MCLQAWVHASVRREVAGRAVELGALLDGKAAAFVHVHSAAVVALVAEAGPVRADGCPETLLLDVGRLCGAQRELEQAAVTAAMLATATHAMMATKDASDAQVGRGSGVDSLHVILSQWTLSLSLSLPPSLPLSLSLSGKRPVLLPSSISPLLYSR